MSEVAIKRKNYDLATMLPFLAMHAANPNHVIDLVLKITVRFLPSLHNLDAVEIRANRVL